MLHPPPRPLLPCKHVIDGADAVAINHKLTRQQSQSQSGGVVASDGPMEGPFGCCSWHCPHPISAVSGLVAVPSTLFYFVFLAMTFAFQAVQGSHNSQSAYQIHAFDCFIYAVLLIGSVTAYIELQGVQMWPAGGLARELMQEVGRGPRVQLHR